jgi:hypothetical protein
MRGVDSLKPQTRNVQAQVQKVQKVQRVFGGLVA